MPLASQWVFQTPSTQPSLPAEPGVLFPNIHLSISSLFLKPKNDFCQPQMKPKLPSIAVKALGLLLGFSVARILSPPSSVNRPWPHHRYIWVSKPSQVHQISPSPSHSDCWCRKITWPNQSQSVFPGIYSFLREEFLLFQVIRLERNNPRLSMMYFSLHGDISSLQ